MKKKWTKISCGADPELFLKDAKTGQLVSSIGRIGGSKDSPIAVPGSVVGLTVQEDNITMELGWNPVTVEQFYATANLAVAEATRYAAERGLVFSWDRELLADDKLLQHPDAQKFGCLPDQDAYLQGAMRPPLDAAVVGNWRFCGGHLHIGYDKKQSQIPDWALIQLLDLAFVTHVGLVEGENNKRGEWYGKPGIFREKPYGVEYRTPSNFWLTQAECAVDIFRVAERLLNCPKQAQAIYRKTDWEAVSKSLVQQRDYVGEWKYEWGNYLDPIPHVAPERLPAPPDAMRVAQWDLLDRNDVPVAAVARRARR